MHKDIVTPIPRYTREKIPMPSCAHFEIYQISNDKMKHNASLIIIHNVLETVYTNSAAKIRRISETNKKMAGKVKKEWKHLNGKFLLHLHSCRKGNIFLQDYSGSTS